MTFVNIFVNIVTEALEKTFWKLTGSMGISEPIRPKINMKNESINRLLYTVMYIENLFNCRNRKESAAKPEMERSTIIERVA